MSAPASHDPLVVSTKDGVTWMRRAVTSEGRGLYAVTDACKCPPYLMATLAELAEHGITGSADVLPMPVDPGPVVRPLAVHEAQIDALAASGNRAVNDAVHEDLCACDAWPESCVSSGGFFQGYWDMGGLETAIPAVLGLWERMRGGELEKLRARVAELEAQRERRRLRLIALQNDALNMRGSLSPNGEERKVPFPLGEALTPAVDWLIARVAELEALLPADALTRTFAPTQALQEDEFHLRHTYRVGRDLPETGGALAQAVREDEPAEAYVSRLLPPRDAACARPDCGHSGADHHHGDTKCWAHLPKEHGEPITICGCSGFVPETGGAL